MIQISNEQDKKEVYIQKGEVPYGTLNLLCHYTCAINCRGKAKEREECKRREDDHFKM